MANRGLNSVFEHLLNVPELRPLSIWWVILLLTTLAILLGPVDYVILKRIDRQPLTWITSAAWIVLFTVGAYYGVQALRSGVAQVRVVSVVDAIEGTNSRWSTTYMGLFAPESDRYKLEDLKTDQWWSGIAPSRDQLFGYRQEQATREILCVQHDGGNLPDSLPINIWSMQCMMSESPARGVPISADLKRLDDGQLSLTITNRSDWRISGGYVRLDENRVMKFGSIEAGKTGNFRGYTHSRNSWDNTRRSRSDGIFGQMSSSAFSRDSAFFARGCLGRTRGIEAYLKDGAAVVCAEFVNVPVPFSVADRKCDNDHIRLVRLVIFPQQE